MSSADDSRDVLKRALLELRALKARVRELEDQRAEPIAIVGMACRFPGGVDDPETYWQMLLAGTDAITEVPAYRFDVDRVYDPDPQAPGKTYSRWGGFLGPVDGFDRQFFNIAPREARSLDPQQRLLLECSWEALERGGQPPADLRNTRTGVFVGFSSRDYADMLWNVPNPALIDAYVGTGNTASVAAGRISYVLGLQGPSIAVDTSCSSSLVATHLACQSLRAGECELAIAAGVNLILIPGPVIYFSKLRALSPNGHCKAFDASADGYVRGEGCGAVALKRLSQAQADGDPIVAVIRGSAINHDGPSSGLTAPNGPSQQAVIRAALTMAGVAPNQVGYVETHGTGTPLGDPIEVMALGAILGRERSAHEPVLIGSVKSNFGHTEAAAGIASLIKAALIVQHGEIPPSLHFRQPSPHIAWEQVPVSVAATRQPWPAYARRRVAGTSSFGFSGTNAHVVLESAPARGGDTASAAASDDLSASPPFLLPLSARSPESLRQLATAYHAFLERPEAEGAVADVVYTAAVRRSHHDHRLAIVGNAASDLRRGLEAFLDGRGHPDWVTGGAIRGGVPPVVLLFPGQGGQWWGMGRELCASEPVFRDVIERCEQAMTPWLPVPLGRLLREPIGQPLLDNDVSVIQPALFAIQVGLAALWRSWGVEPAAVVGHSLGEIAAAVAAGALTLEEGARVVCVRSRIVQRARGQGRMVVAELTQAEAEEAVSKDGDRLAVAAVNGPKTTILAGDAEALDALVATLEARDVFTRAVKVDYASHSPQMDALLPSIRSELAGLQPRAAELPFHSTVTGAPIAGSEMDANYWADNLRAQVRFWPVVSALAAASRTVFLEISPHPVLSSAVADGLRTLERPGVVVGSLRREEPERAALLRALATAHVHGVPIDWKRFHRAGGNVVALPTYAWQREHCWIDTGGEAVGIQNQLASAAAVGTIAPEPTEVERAAELALSSDPATRLDAYVQDRIARILLMPAGLQLDRSLPLSALGLDSLMAAELRHWIQRDLGIKLPTADARGKNITEVVEYLRAAVADRDVVAALDARAAPATVASATVSAAKSSSAGVARAAAVATSSPATIALGAKARTTGRRGEPRAVAVAPNPKMRDIAIVAGTATAVPGTYYTQEKLSELLRNFLIAHGLDFDLELVDQVFRSTGIQGRAFGMQLDELLEPQDLNDFYGDAVQAITSLSEEALSRLFASDGLGPGDVSAITVATTATLAAPTFEARLMNRLPFPRHTKRFPLVGLGCMGGAAGLARVSDYLCGHPDEAAVLVAVEMCSQAWRGPFQAFFANAIPRLQQQPELYKEIMANVVSAALFSDGAGAVILVGRDHPKAAGAAPRVLDSLSNIVPDTEDVMGIAIGATGVRSVLRPDVPVHAAAALRSVIRTLLARHDLEPSDIGQWLVHPGGPKVLDAVCQEFGLTDDDVRLSRDVLTRYGNVSSATVLFMLDHARRCAPPPSGTLGVMVAMGPGFSQEAILLQW